MTIKNLFLAFALLAILLTGCVEPQAPEIRKFSASNENPSIGESIIVQVEAAGNEPEKIVLDAAGIQEVNCTTAPCKANFKVIFPEKGAYKIKATAFFRNAPAILQSKTIYVLDTSKTCIDGTAFGSCSASQPYYCSEGKLIEKCSVCGCRQDFICEGDSCSVEAKPLVIENASFNPRFAAPNSDIQVELILKNESNAVIHKGAVYKAGLVISGNNQFSTSRVFSLDQDLNAGSTILKNFMISKPLLDSGTFDLNAAIFANGTLLHSFLRPAALTIRVDSNPPAPPLLLSASRGANNEVSIHWQANTEPDIMHYKLYRSISSSPVFISYSFDISIDGNKSSVIVPVNAGQHYFVLTAVDYFGNESGFSNVVSVSLE